MMFLQLEIVIRYISKSGDFLFLFIPSELYIRIFISLNYRDATGDLRPNEEKRNKPARAANFREIS